MTSIFNFKSHSNLPENLFGESSPEMIAFDLATWLDQQEFYVGIGQTEPWGINAGTGISETNPPVPFRHRDTLHNPVVYKRCKFQQLALPEQYLDSDLIIKKIDRNFYDQSQIEKSFLVLDKSLIPFAFDPHITHLYLEVDFTFEELQNLGLETYREIGIFANLPISDSIENQSLTANYTYPVANIESINLVPAFLSFFTPLLVEPRKDLNLRFLLDLNIEEPSIGIIF